MDDTSDPLDDLLDLLTERVGEDKAKVIYLECMAAEQFKRGRTEGQVSGDAPGARTADLKGRLTRIVALPDDELDKYAERALTALNQLSQAIKDDEGDEAMSEHDDDLELTDEAGLLAVLHSPRFRQVSNRYPRLVAEAYDGDIAAAAADSDEQVAARVAEWERAHGLEPRDWRRIGESERADEFDDEFFEDE